MDHKTFSAYTLKADAAQGIVESIVAVMGNADQGDDVIHPGAFLKTITERRGKIRVLDQHQTDSIMRAIGKPLELREMSRAELPADLLIKYPTATGGLYAKTQYLMNTPEGKGAFERIVAGAVDEYSIGYDALDNDFSSIAGPDGQKKTVRNLRTLKLYEYSPVLFGMNSATTTLSTKDQPTEGKPWAVFHEGDKWNVYKLDADGNQTGKPLGEHDSEEEARAQVGALYANEGKASKEAAQSFNDALMQMVNERNLSEMRWQLECAMSESLESIAKDGALDATAKTDMMRQSLTQYSDALINWFTRAIEAGMYEQESDQGMMARMYSEHVPETKAGRVIAGRNMERLTRIMTELQAVLADATANDQPTDDEAPADDEQAAKSTNETAQAGPFIETPTIDALRMLEAELNLTYFAEV